MENLPKKLIADKKIKSFILDENGNDALLTYSSESNYPAFRDEVIKRYNDYELLKVYVIGLMLAVLTLTFALCTKDNI